MQAHRTQRSRPPAPEHDGYGDPAIEALTRLLESERRLAQEEEPLLAQQFDPGSVWLLWFAIGATDEICRYAHRRGEIERNQVFRHAVSLIFGGGVHSTARAVDASQHVIGLFESAGGEAVRACMRGDRKLGYYLEALKVGAKLQG